MIQEGNRRLNIKINVKDIQKKESNLEKIYQIWCVNGAMKSVYVFMYM